MGIPTGTTSTCVPTAGAFFPQNFQLNEAEIDLTGAFTLADLLQMKGTVMCQTGARNVG